MFPVDNEPRLAALLRELGAGSPFSRDATHFARQYEKSELWTAAHLRALQLAKLRRLAWHCLLRVPHYIEALPRLLRPDEIETLVDPTRLPSIHVDAMSGDRFVARDGEGMPPPDEVEARRRAIVLRSIRWGQQRSEWWTLDKVGVVATPCGQARAGEKHVHADHLLVESAANGSLLVTDLHEFQRPMLRVDFGVRGRLVEDACRCGRALTRLVLE